eukprot:gene4694-8266_t
MYRTKDLFDVSDKVVVITGGGRGIGLMIAKGYVSNGSTVYISSRNKETCEQVAKELTKEGPGKCIAIAADISKESDCIYLSKKVEENEKEGIDVLINNAGCNWGEKFETYPDSSWDKVMSLNVKGVFNVTRCFLPQLKLKAKEGNPSSVIMIGSIDGIRIPALENYAYSTSKAALHHLTKVLANKFADENIIVNAIAPGPFESKMMAATLKKFGKQIVKSVPLNRIGSEEDIIGACIFLSSKASAWMTGNIIQLDGGILIKSSF